MSILDVSKSDIKVLLYIRPPFMVLLCYVLFGNAFFRNLNILIPVSIAAFINMIVTWRIHIYADFYLRKRFFNYDHTLKRLMFSITFHFLIGIVMFNIVLYWADYVHFLDYRFTYNIYLLSLLVVFCTNLAATGFHEGVYMFQNWKKMLVESEELKKLMLKNRLSGLRNQTAPHFFFNNINTLSELIEEEPDKADKFLNEICIVYRYLLQNPEETYVPLDKEMVFLQSWIHLVETRYGKAIKFDIDWMNTLQNISISKLTLLSFLENILVTYVLNPKDCFHIILKITNEYLEIIHPIRNKKVKTSMKSEQQVEEVKLIHRLIGNKEIEEFVSGNIKTIVIPVYHNE